MAAPEVAMPRLLAAFKVADVAGATIYGTTGDNSAPDRWRTVWKLLLYILREQLQRPLLSKREVMQLKLCLRQLRPWCTERTGINWKKVEGDDVQALEATAKGYDSFPKGPSRRGRKLTEHQRRIIASVELLHQCGVPYACEKVGLTLESYGIRRDAKTVLNLWSRYNKYRLRHPEREATPSYFIKGMLWSVMPDVNAWVRTQAGKGGMPRHRRRQRTG